MQRIEIAKSVDTVSHFSDIFVAEVTIDKSNTQIEKTVVMETELEEGEKVPKRS